MFKQITSLFKLRIGVIMMFTALVAMAVTPGRSLNFMEITALAFAVLISAASAGAFNQYFEVDLDGVMKRTSQRPFVTGAFHKSPAWLLLIGMLLVVGVSAAAFVLNWVAAMYIFLGAFFYAVIYTVWLKRRTSWNIVIGGASGSFAVLAGAASVDPSIGPIPALLAMVLFFWTPSHFWSLAIAKRDEYAAAGVPMLSVEIGNLRTARVAMINTLLLVSTSIVPYFYGLGWIYLVAASVGGGYFVLCNYRMMLQPSKSVSMRCFFASLVQLVILLAGAILDVSILG